MIDAQDGTINSEFLEMSHCLLFIYSDISHASMASVTPGASHTP